MTGRRPAGYTLLEIMVVVFILGLLATLVAPKILGRTEDARRTKAIADMKAIEQALNLYRLDTGTYPTTAQGIEALVHKPQTPPVPQRPPRVRHPKGVSPDGIAYNAVRRAFARAQRALKIDWKLYGRGHCDRVTLKPHYSRHARCGASESVAWFSPSGALSRRYLFPAALVRRAASLLRVDANVLISRSW